VAGRGACSAAQPRAPPPSSIAISTADAYDELRSAGNDDGAQDLRPPDTCDQATGYAPALQEPVTTDAASGGFDAVSGAIGAAAGIGLAIATVALAGRLVGVRLPRRDAARS